ncbi:hypothetical protein GSI_09901 [Ganoderma sinense ZZ0214-1]|uniref:RNA-directed DNA polymerase n=1 Tax=Ganoderma sinense ZZ0214-1 TaxID=1077348 RepID=A0A2G8S2J2_9APHY|nr:hypothetical protein GSI_09901 [Ganoderma sinense ZZ0214-1]
MPSPAPTDSDQTPIVHYTGRGGSRQLSLRVTLHDPGTNSTFDEEALIDSGATASYVDEGTVRAQQIETNKLERPIIVYNADGTENVNGRITHTCTLRLRIGNHEEERTFFVTQLDSHHVFLGHDWLKHHNPAIDWKTKDVQFNRCPDACDYIPEEGDRLFALNTITYLRSRSLHHEIRAKTSVAMELAIQENAKKPKKTIEELVPQEYHTFLDVFREDSFDTLPEHRSWDHVIELLEPYKPYAGKVYPMTLTEQEALDAFLEENLRTGRIKPSQSPWAASFFFVKKKDGKLRPVQDYRQLNAMTKKNKYPLPVPQQLIDQLKKAKYFTKMDVRWGYNNIRMKTEQDQERAAFITNRGLFEPTVMFFGLTNSPATFQKMMNDILKPLKDQGHVIVYLDDILIFTETLEEHHELTRKVLEILRQHHLTCKPEKCDFTQLEIEYLGHIISQGLVRMDPTKVEGVTTWPLPKTKKELQSFLGFANFYRRFIKDFSKIAHPLHALTGNDPWNWGPDQTAAFEQIKHTITTAPVLAIPNDEDLFKVESDASDFAIGAVLSQKQNDIWKPIAFLSKSLSPAERNYEIWDKEMLSVITALKEWRHFLLGSKQTFEIHNDHRNLQYFVQPQNLNPRQARWYLRLRDYDFILIHKPGSTMAKADALSRRADHAPISGNPINEQVLFLKPHWFRVLGADTLTTKIKAANTLHHDFVKKQLKANNPLFKTEDGLVYRGGKIVVPNQKTLIGEVIESSHDNPTAGHPGRARTLEKLSRIYWWKTMKRDVFRYIDGCEKCQKVKPDPRKRAAPLHPNPIPTHNYQNISVDLIVELPDVGGKNAIMVVVDAKSKDIIAIPISNKINSEGVAKAFRDHVMAQHGLPQRITSDRGSVFVSNFIRELYKLLGITGNPSTAYHPQTDGQTERMNHMIEIYLRTYCNYRQTDWPELLPMACFSHRNSINASTGFTPFFMLYGRHPFTGVETLIDSPNEAATTFAERMKQVQDEASASMKRAQEVMKEVYDRKRTPARTYNVGDWVYVSSKDIVSQRPQQKLDDKRYGPFYVLEKVGSSAYKLKLPESLKLIHPVFNEVLLLPQTSPDFPNQTNPRERPQSPPNDDEPRWKPEAIYNARWNKGTLEYLVRWVGLPSYESTWNKRAFMVEQGWLALLDRFHKDNPDAPRLLTVKLAKAREIVTIPDYERDWRRWDATFERWQQRRVKEGLPLMTTYEQPTLLSSATYSPF